MSKKEDLEKWVVSLLEEIRELKLCVFELEQFQGELNII